MIPAVTAQKPPEPLKKGPKWLRNKINEIIQFSLCTRPLPGENVTAMDGPDGRMMNAIGTNQPAPPTNAFPFQLIITTPGNVRVVYGTINGIAPDGMTLGDIPPYIIAVSGTGSIYLEVTTDADGNITDRSIGSAGSLPPDTTGDYHQEIGSFATDTGGNLVLAQSISGSQAFELCGGVNPLWGLV